MNFTIATSIRKTSTVRNSNSILYDFQRAHQTVNCLTRVNKGRKFLACIFHLRDVNHGVSITDKEVAWSWRNRITIWTLHCALLGWREKKHRCHLRWRDRKQRAERKTFVRIFFLLLFFRDGMVPTKVFKMRRGDLPGLAQIRDNSYQIRKRNDSLIAFFWKWANSDARNW